VEILNLTLANLSSIHISALRIEGGRFTSKEKIMSRNFQENLWITSRLVFTVAILLSLLIIVPAASAQGTVTLKIESASVDKLGIVTVNLTVTCSEPFIFGEDLSGNFLDVVVRQPYKRIYTIIGQGGLSFISECAGTTQYAIQAFADPGKFAPGIAYIFADIQLCPIDSECVHAQDFFNSRIH
jgi:hypothetical protein